MNVDTDSLPVRGLPAFLEQAEVLCRELQSKSPEELQKLWKCNDQIAALNVERLRQMNLRRNLTPAVLAYEGIQYQYMAPRVFTNREYEYIQEHLRILSGFYGVLRPFDGVLLFSTVYFVKKCKKTFKIKAFRQFFCRRYLTNAIL